MEQTNQTKNIFEELEVSEISDSDKTIILKEIESLTEERMIERMDIILSDEQKESLFNFSEENKNSPLAIMNFIISMMPNYNDILEEEVIKIKKELIQEYNANRNK